MVRARNFEINGANACTEEPKTVRCGQSEILGIVKGFACVDVCHAVHVMNSTESDEFNAFACMDGQVVW